MFQYFVRRCLLAIPTFIGATIVIFFVVQIAPGGAYEQQLNALRKGQGAEGAGSATGMEGMSLPPSQLEALQRYYQVDKPIWERYLIWLGLMPRPVNDYQTEIGQPRNVGNGKRVIVQKDAAGYKVFNAENPTEQLTDWNVDPSKKAGSVWVYQKKFSGIVTFDFGTSFQYRKPVTELVLDRIDVSMQFGIIGFIISYIISFYLGVQKALRHGSAFDAASSSIVFLAYSLPAFAVGATLLVLLGGGSFLSIFPTGGFQSPDYSDLSLLEKIGDRMWYFVLPTVAYTLNGFASLTMLMKNSLLDTLGQDYVRTAYAKGLREDRVIWMHAMRNSIIPLIASIGGVIGIFLAGNYLIEVAFNIEGIGKLSFDAILYRDSNVFFAFAMISVMITIVGSMISDFLLAMVDPRIRFS
ncbi:MAG: ABC transporter permease subunit [Chlorobi bacterium]|nr:MAG: ABC transporter permease subunit [Bacteroidota bacterium]KXK33700.1 MAG: peptide/nickel transport system permease protein [Chlorobi bacterium OLB6]MBE2265539.1 ABC transporter permease subunit [Flavobacteriales bacterium]MBL1160707.1 ABC transporter permease subunit [Chlorobiota bacterium]MBW7853058.1 ABC transporter permease subunit [Candidatus Kapabacteria bacterium]MCC6331453.1 ABC transporter permease subunit [Ignavibacteria bacterium]